MGRQGQKLFAETMIKGFSEDDMKKMQEFMERMKRNLEEYVR